MKREYVEQIRSAECSSATVDLELVIGSARRVNSRCAEASFAFPVRLSGSGLI
jgi:hypothetical protein